MEPKLPNGLFWTKEGFKYLGVFLADEMFMQKKFLKELLRRLKVALTNGNFSSLKCHKQDEY